LKREAVTVATKSGWIGASSKEDARNRIMERFPEGQIIRLYEKILGMFAYEVEVPDTAPEPETEPEGMFHTLEERAPEEVVDEPPPTLDGGGT